MLSYLRGAAVGALIPAALVAQEPPRPTEVGTAHTALATLPAKSATKLTVTSPAFTQGGDIPFENTQYRGNAFPGLSWTAGPAGTKTYVLIMQDGDILRGTAPFLHWTMVNIPGTMTKLEPGMTTPPAGVYYGPTMRGPGQPYAGPRTPPGPKHRYHFQVFALDRALPQDSTTTTYSGLTAAMKDHVLASGELVGLGQAPPPAPPPSTDTVKPPQPRP